MVNSHNSLNDNKHEHRGACYGKALVMFMCVTGATISQQASSCVSLPSAQEWETQPHQEPFLLLCLTCSASSKIPFNNTLPWFFSTPFFRNYFDITTQERPHQAPANHMIRPKTSGFELSREVQIHSQRRTKLKDDYLFTNVHAHNFV